jgi:hypothetical protein
MNDEQRQDIGEIRPQYQTYNRQKCFIAYSEQAYWSADLLGACEQVLSKPEFNLEPDYARKHFASDVPLRQKAIELIANARYGIYDLSCWRADDKSPWQMPRNVFIELGIAIALNRPTLLLRHASNKEEGLELPNCLQSLGEQILEFSGKHSLKTVLLENFPKWVNTGPEQAWWNRYCIFGGRVCEHLNTHPGVKQLEQNTLNCIIADGADSSRPDFREIVEDVLGRFSDVTYTYLDALSLEKGYSFLLCTHCQKVRSSPFAIYRITLKTPPEAFITIGMSLALETQFKYKISKILITEDLQIVPSLLSGYEVIVAKSDNDKKKILCEFMPDEINKVKQTKWKPRPLPFLDISVNTTNEDELDKTVNSKTIAAEIQKLLEKLEKSYPTDTNTGKMMLAGEVLKQVENNPTFTARILSAVKAGGVKALEQFFSHPAASFSIGALEDWLKNNETQRDIDDFGEASSETTAIPEIPSNINTKTGGFYKPIIVEGVAVISFEDEDEDGNITSKTVEITSDDLDWEVSDVEERQMGTEIAHAATYYFDRGEIEWTVWEYPMGATNDSDYRIEGGTLVKNFDSLEVNNEEPY